MFAVALRLVFPFDGICLNTSACRPIVANKILTDYKNTKYSNSDVNIRLHASKASQKTDTNA